MRNARGRWHRTGQGLRRGILLGLRETAKSIAAGPELASGSDSRPCRNNAVSRSPSSNHPSSAAARPDATFLWLTLPTDRKKARAWDRSKHQRNIKESRIQEPDRHSVPPPIPKHTGTSQHPPLLHNQELLKKARGVCRGAAALRPLCGFPFLHKKIAPTSQRCKS